MSNARFKAISTTLLIAALVALPLGQPAIGAITTVIACVVIWELSLARAYLLLVSEIALIAIAFTPLAYVAYAANTALAAFVTWFAWTFRLRF